MPYYDYRCEECNRPNRHFYSFKEYASAEPTCTICGSKKLRRRIGRVAVAKSDDSRADSMMDESMLSALESEDPKTLGRFMREMSAESGEPLDDEFGEVVDRLEKGQSPEQIEQAMPDLAADAGGGAGGGGGFDDF